MRYLLIVVLSACMFGVTWAAEQEHSALMDEAIELLTKGEYDTAVAKLREAIRKKQDPEAYMLLGTALNEAGEYDQALEALQKARQLKTESSAILFEMGRSYLELGRYKEAYESFSQDISDNPWRDKSYLLCGMCLYRLGEYKRAVEYLKDSVSKEIRNLPQAYYYIGLCQVQLEEYADAEESFKRVSRASRGTGLGEDADERASLLGKLMQAKKKERPWYASVRLGVSTDTNVLSAGEDVPLPSDISRKRDVRTALALLAGYRPYKSSDSELWVDYRGNATFHKDLTDYDSQMSGVALRAIYRPREKVRSGIRLGYDHTWVGGDAYSGIFGLTPFLSYRQRPWAAVTFAYTWQQSDYRFDLTNPALNRDGYTNAISVTEDIVVPKTELSMRAGLMHSWRDSDGDDYDFNSLRMALNLWHPFFFEGTTLRGGASYTLDDYENPNSRSATSQTRDDGRLGLSIGLTKEFSTGTAVYMSYDWIHNDSNIGVFEYTRGIWSLGAIHAF